MLVVDRVLEPASQRLMDFLGVRVEVVSAVVNRDVRAVEGANGEVVIVAAWCPKCEQESGPNSEGECFFCGTRIVDEDRLSAKELLAAARANGDGRALGEVAAVGQFAGSGSAPRMSEPERAAASPSVRAHSRAKVTADECVAAIRGLAERLGRAPYSRDYPKRGVRPSLSVIYTLFRSWDEALAAAGLSHEGSGLEPSGPEAAAPSEARRELTKPAPPAVVAVAQPELAVTSGEPGSSPDTAAPAPLIDQLLAGLPQLKAERDRLHTICAGLYEKAETLDLVIASLEAGERALAQIEAQT